MFFTHLARVVAVIVFMLAVFRVLLGLAVAAGYMGPYEAALARYTTAPSSGRMVDTGLYAILFAIALGTLAEISISVRKRQSH